jgi:hypothetical protein
VDGLFGALAEALRAERAAAAQRRDAGARASVLVRRLLDLGVRSFRIATVVAWALGDDLDVGQRRRFGRTLLRRAQRAHNVEAATGSRRIHELPPGEQLCGDALSPGKEETMPTLIRKTTTVEEYELNEDADRPVDETDDEDDDDADVEHAPRSRKARAARDDDDDEDD